MLFKKVLKKFIGSGKKFMKKEQLDEIDSRILRILQHNARTSYREIQETLGISIGTIHNRINKMKSREIIEGYTLKLSNFKLGYKLCFLIRVHIDGKYTEEILDEIKQKPEVCSVFHTTGEQSATLICRFRESEDVHDFIRELNEKKHILRTISNMVLKEYKNTSYVEI
ncbi:MAG: Lrp/AsnC family transcriptional regulator [Promethearchaeota archaeon]